MLLIIQLIVQDHVTQLRGMKAVLVKWVIRKKYFDWIFWWKMTASIENQGTIFDCFRFYIYFVTVLFYIIGMVIEVPQNTVYPKSETIFQYSAQI